MMWKTPPDRPRGPHENTAWKIPVDNTSRSVKDGLPLQSTSVTDLFVAPAGWSAERCTQGHFLPESYPAHSAQWTMCECGAPRDDERYAVRYSSIELLRNAAHAQQFIWWHLSTSSNLFVNDLEKYMHWGEFDTVMHHFVAYNKPSKRDENRMLYLYSAMLLPDRHVAVEVIVENEGATQHDDLKRAYDRSGPTRYLNVRERPGSVSLVARKRDFLVHQAFDLEQHDETVIKLP
ncbi:hypothetical protein [Clavibacter michiganensis]|uniref:hypothetical protein n=1 Tax=Clavibacter michiganensis TaxID=28447 RepID=UPI003078EB14